MKTPVEKIGSRKPAASPTRAKFSPTSRSIRNEKSLRVYTCVTRSATRMRSATHGVSAMVRVRSSSGVRPHSFT